MADPARVTVIMPSYNHARFIGEAIESVLGQTFGDLELIIVDNASTDNTREVVGRYLADPRVRAIWREENGGVAVARNEGLALARGEFVAFLDSDDLWLPEKLEKQLPLFDGPLRPGLVYCDMYCFGESGVYPKTVFQARGPGEPCPGVALADLAVRNWIQVPTVVVRASCIAKVGLFDASLTRTDDYDMWLRIAAEYPLACVPEALAMYRLHAAQAHRDRREMLSQEIAVRRLVLRRYGERLRSGVRRRVRQQIAEYAASLGHELLVRNARIQACRWLLVGLLGHRGSRMWCIGGLLSLVLPAPAVRVARRVKWQAEEVVRTGLGVQRRPCPKRASAATPECQEVPPGG
jgi:glycosyltransferase involved in cell wall biosynthesis